MSEIVDMVLDDSEERMDKVISHARTELASIRSGRAAPALVERIRVEAYGVTMQIVELASISVPESRQLLITPHDPENLEPCERAIRASDLGLSPANDGRTLRLNFPPLTTERRKELVRLVKKMAEEARISIRGVRRDGRKDLETAEKDGDLSADELARAEKEVDKLTQAAEGKVDAVLADKEAELLEV